MSPTQTPRVIPQKRPRPIKSCLACRNKKLRCDRLTPCSQCTKSRTRDCIYEEFSSDRSAPNLAASGDSPVMAVTAVVPVDNGNRREMQTPMNSTVQEEMKRLYERVTHLERVVIQNETYERNRNEEHTLASSSSTGNFSTHYHGLRNKRALSALFPDVLKQVSLLFADSETQKWFPLVHKMFPGVANKTCDSGQRPKLVDIYAIITELQSKETHVPNSSSSDWFDGPYLMVDKRNLVRNYENLQQTTDHTPRNIAIAASQGLVCLLHNHVLQQPTERTIQEARRHCRVIEMLLNSVIGKPRASSDMLQALCLSALCKMAFGASPVEIWRLSSELLHLAVSQGFHYIHENRLSNVPTLDEACQRLWWTIVELNIQSSMAAGMPSLLQSLPLAEFSPRLANLPATRDPRHSSLYYQDFMVFSVPLRLKALELLNEASPVAATFQKVIADLERARCNLPEQTHINGRKENLLLTGQDFKSTMADMCFRRPVLGLYTRLLHILQKSTLSSKDTNCDRALSFFMSTLAVHEALDTDVDKTRETSRPQARVLQDMYERDMTSAAYGACLALTIGRRMNVNFTFPRTVAWRMIDEYITSTLLSKPIVRPLIKHLFSLSLALQLCKSHEIEHDKVFEASKRTFERFIDLCRERTSKDGLLFQVEPTMSDEFDAMMTEDFMFGEAMFWNWDTSPSDPTTL